MVKTVKINGKNINFSLAAKFIIIYRNNFNKDIGELVFPLLGSIMTSIQSAKNDTEIMSVVFNELSGKLELVDILNLLWSMAYAADDSIPSADVFFDDFSITDVYKMISELLEPFISSLAVKKNTK